MVREGSAYSKISSSRHKECSCSILGIGDTLSRVNAKVAAGANVATKWRNQFSFAARTFNIITTKRNRTAIAPTYIIRNIIAINSIFGVNTMSKPVALQKTKIRKITECIGFVDTIVPKELTKAILANESNKSVCIWSKNILVTK